MLIIKPGHLRILEDMALAPKMMKRGKLNIIPELIKDRSGVAAIFRKSKKLKSESSPKTEVRSQQLPTSDFRLRLPTNLILKTKYMTLGFYPGCSLKGSSREYAESVLAVAKAFDIRS